MDDDKDQYRGISLEAVKVIYTLYERKLGLMVKDIQTEVMMKMLKGQT